MVGAVAEQISKTDEGIRYQSTTTGCFIKGTRVFTKEGKKPIEEIQVGDYVLSSPEDGSGKPEYKRVLRTFVNEPQRIFYVSILPEGWEYPDSSHFVVATGNHPFWVEGIDWTLADQLKPQQRLRQGNGGFATVGGVKPIYRTGKSGIGWVTGANSLESRGTVFDYANYALASEEDKKRFVFLPEDIVNSDDPYIRVPVYNFEVEDFRTYYVGGKYGYWVHG